MGRPREFERDTVLRQACDVFWARGYAATSVDDLTRAMGIGRGSLYHEFGDKHALFVEALDGYCAERLSQLTQVLETAPSVRAGISGLLRGIVAMLWSAPLGRGCLLVNSTTELAAADPDVAARSAAAFERVAQVLATALERGKHSGELAACLDVRATARYLASALNGLRLLAKMTDREVADDVVEVTLKVLD